MPDVERIVFATGDGADVRGRRATDDRGRRPAEASMERVVGEALLWYRERRTAPKNSCYYKTIVGPEMIPDCVESGQESMQSGVECHASR